MQVNADQRYGQVTQQQQSTNVAAENKVVKTTETSVIGLSNSADTVSISAEAIKLLNDDNLVAETDSVENSSGEDEGTATTNGNGSGTVPDLPDNKSASSTTPGNGSGTVPPDLN